jgi:hypothetical protein
MDTLSTIFAAVVTVLAALACVGALAVVLVAEVYAIRRTIQRHRRPTLSDPMGRWWREHLHVSVPEQDSIRRAAGRLLGGDSVQRIARERRP